MGGNTIGKRDTIHNTAPYIFDPTNAKVHIQSVEAIVREWLMKYDRLLVGSEAEKRLVEELQKL